jgi:hypothetical protein
VPLTIGNASDGSEPFSGMIEEVRLEDAVVYTTAFDPDARFSPDPTTLALFHLTDSGATAVDSSSNKNNATLKTGATFVAACEPAVCNWVHTPGIATTGTIDVPLPSPDVLTPGNSFTIEGWFRENSGTGWAVSHGAQTGYGLYTDHPDNNLFFQLTCAGGVPHTIQAPVAPSQRIWHHWAGVFDGVAQTMTLFADGVNVASGPTGCAATATESAGLDFGQGSTSIDPGEYDMSEIRLSSTPRYTTTFQPEKTAVRFTTDLDTIALYHFDETSGTIVHDSSGTDAGLNGGLNGVPLPTFGQCQ